MAQAHSLEKAMVNGWDGSEAALSLANKSTQLFFHASRVTCMDWLARIRPSLIKVAFNAGMYSEVVRQAWYVLPALVGAVWASYPGQHGVLVLGQAGRPPPLDRAVHLGQG